MSIRFSLGLVLMFFLVVSFVSAGKVVYNFPFKGVSMLPVLEPYRYIKVSTIDQESLFVGDIVCYNYDKREYGFNDVLYICHRIVDITETHICTKGDNNPNYDNCIEKKYVALKVII